MVPSAATAVAAGAPPELTAPPTTDPTPPGAIPIKLDLLEPPKVAEPVKVGVIPVDPKPATAANVIKLPCPSGAVVTGADGEETPVITATHPPEHFIEQNRKKECKALMQFTSFISQCEVSKAEAEAAPTAPTLVAPVAPVAPTVPVAPAAPAAPAEAPMEVE